MNLRWAEEHFRNLGRFYDLYRNYYSGEHESFYGKIQKYRNLNDLIQGTRSNVCKTVADILVSRLDLKGFRTENAEAYEFVRKYFRANRTVSLAKAVHRNISVYGDAYISFWYDTDGIRLFCEQPNNTAIHYSEYDQPDMAVKFRFCEDGDNRQKTKVWIYTDEEIITGVRDGCDLCFSDIKGEVSVPNPFRRVPFFHFSNTGDPKDFAKSDLYEVIPLQRNLNKTLQDRALASELSAFKQKWATGIAYEVDEATGKRISPFKSELSKIWMTDSPDTKFGEFSETDLSIYTGVIDSLHTEVSCVSGVPLHLFNLRNGNFPSGEALRTAESPLIAKITDKQLIYGDVWEDVFSALLSLCGIECDDLEAEWGESFK